MNNRKSLIFFFLTFILFCVSGFCSPEKDDSGNAKPLVRFVYFTPSDGTPLSDAPERLFRVISHIQHFYQSEMERAGYGKLTFDFETDPENPSRLLLHYVKGESSAAEYTKGDYVKIRKEVTESLTKGTNGLPPIHPSSEIIIVFQQLVEYSDMGETLIHVPIVGAGNHLFGIALAIDDSRLDSGLLTSELPADPNGTISLGEFNTRYIGAIAHELGHAFGLLHNAETDLQRRTSGWSLMGIGNNYYGAELRGKGKGAFLTAGDTLRLSRCRAFIGDIPYAFKRPKWQLLDLKGEYQKTPEGEIQLHLKGRINSNVQLLGVTFYNDDALIPGDYDAKSFTAVPDADGSFDLTIRELAETDYQLRMIGVYANGAVEGTTVTYAVDSALSPSGLERLNTFAAETLMRRLFECWNADKLKEVIEDEKKQNAPPVLIRKGEHLLRRMKAPPALKDPSEIAEEVKEWKLSESVWENARNGIDVLLRDRVPEDLFITVGGAFYDSGLFAHAPSVYRFQLGKKWSEFRTQFGIADGHCGSVRFRIVADGKDLYMSSIVRDHRIGEAAVSVKEVSTLDLVVEPAGDGNSHDWGVWVNPVILR